MVIEGRDSDHTAFHGSRDGKFAHCWMEIAMGPVDGLQSASEKAEAGLEPVA
jgi:hypothetical protein